MSVYYSLNGEEATSVIETLYSLYCDTEATLTYESAELPDKKTVVVLP